MNIALIDDEAAILENVRKCVENEIVPQDEASLFTYTRAKDFLQEMEQGYKFDILVSDIDMPEMGGLELGKRIQEEGGGPYLREGLDDTGRCGQGAASGAWGFGAGGRI